MTKQTKTERATEATLLANRMDRLTAKLRHLVCEIDAAAKDQRVDPDHRVALSRALGKLEEADNILGESGL